MKSSLFASTVPLFLALAIAQAPAGEQAGTLILDSGSHWRVERVTVPPVVRTKDGKLVPLSTMKGDHEKGGYKLPAGGADKLPAWPELAADWFKPDFDDSVWGLGRGRVVVNNFYIRSANDGRLALALVRARGRFLVADPAAARDLTLDLRYQGGVVVYLNGREVARGHLPAGKILPETPGEDYPDEAVVAPDGRALSAGFGDPEKYKDRFAKRDRELAGIKLPADALVKGANVLAIEVHRSPMPEVQVTSKHAHKESWWTGMELGAVRLTAAAAGPVVPNASKPAGLAVWTCGTAWRVGKDEIGDRSESGKPLRIVACRNGVFSGQAVVISDKPMSALKAVAGELKSADGKGAIPATAVQVRYALPDGSQPTADNGGQGWFDGLDEVPPAEVPLRVHNWRPWEKALDKTYLAVEPVWVTVRVPAEAPAGEYRGSLSIDTGNQGKVAVSVEVKVHAWTAPDSKNYATFVEMDQSPETLAGYYKVPMWSEEHWELIEESFEQIGAVGGKLVFIPVIARARFGNEHGMIRWIKKGDGWDYDTSVLEKYLDVAIRHLGKVPVVNFHISEPNQQAHYWKLRRLGEKATVPPLKVTELDPKTGALANIDAPVFGTPESVPFWKPAFDRIRAVMKARGLEGSMMIGTEHDLGFHPKIHVDRKLFAPDFRWLSCTHPGPNDAMTAADGSPVGYATNVWKGLVIPNPSRQRLYGWKWADSPGSGIHCYWPRTGLTESAEMGKISGMLETLIAGGYANARQGYAGLGHQGADFWRVPAANGKSANILDKFPEAIWGSLNIQNGTEAWLRPGPKGPLGTARLETLREGIEEANARVFIERALTDPAARARLGDELAGKVQAVLDARVAILARCDGADEWADWLAGYEARREQLFSAADEVAAKLGK